MSQHVRSRQARFSEICCGQKTYRPKALNKNPSTNQQDASKTNAPNNCMHKIGQCVFLIVQR